MSTARTRARPALKALTARLETEAKHAMFGRLTSADIREITASVAERHDMKPEDLQRRYLAAGGK